MKKNYFIVALLIFVFAANATAQFREVTGKSPVFHITFSEDNDYGSAIYPNGKLITSGTELVNWLKTDSTDVVGDTIRGHQWSGAGSFDEFTFEEKVISSDDLKEVFGPAMWWPSWTSTNDRADGIAAYSDGNGAYPGPMYDLGRTIAFYVMYTDSTILDSDNGRDGGAHRLYDVGKWNVEGGGGMIRWLIDPATMQFQFDWGGAKDFSEENIFTKGEWTHLALTIPQGGARADVKFYVNGIPKSFVADSASGDITNLYTVPTAGWDGIRICNLMNSWMADYRVYASELTEDEIRKMLGLNAVSVKSAGEVDIFSIYPVPNNGVFTVEPSAPGVSKLVVSNMLGQVVANRTIEQAEVIDMGGLSSGVYFISLTDSNNNTQTKRFMLQ